jgi:hypothetical protein
MKNFTYFFLSALLMTGFNSCAVVGGIFKAGVWVGVLIVVGIIALILFLVSRASGKK